MISRIIKGEVSVISLSLQLRLIALTETLIILDITKNRIQSLFYYTLKVSNKIQNSKEGHSTSERFKKPCADRVFYLGFVAFFSLRYSWNTCLYFRWPFRVLSILIFQKFFKLRLIHQANQGIVFIQLLIVQCKLCDRALHMTKYPELSAARGIEIETSMYNNLYYISFPYFRVNVWTTTFFTKCDGPSDICNAHLYHAQTCQLVKFGHAFRQILWNIICKNPGHHNPPLPLCAPFVWSYHQIFGSGVGGCLGAHDCFDIVLFLLLQ